MTRWDLYDKLLKHMGTKDLLDDIVRAMSDKQFADIAEFIMRMEGIE